VFGAGCSLWSERGGGLFLSVLWLLGIALNLMSSYLPWFAESVCCFGELWQE